MNNIPLLNQKGITYLTSNKSVHENLPFCIFTPTTFIDTMTVAMDMRNGNITGILEITGLDFYNAYNIIQMKLNRDQEGI